MATRHIHHSSSLMLFSITNQQGNGDQNHNDIPIHTCEEGYFKKPRASKCWPESREKITLILCWWGCRIVWPHWKTAWRFLKIWTKLPYDPAIALLGIYPKEMKSGSWRYIYTMFTATYNSQDMEAIQISVNK